MMKKRTRGVPLSRALLEVFIDDDLFLEMSLIAHMWTCLRKQVRTWNTAHTQRERKRANVTWQQLNGWAIHMQYFAAFSNSTILHTCLCCTTTPSAGWGASHPVA